MGPEPNATDVHIYSYYLHYVNLTLPAVTFNLWPFNLLEIHAQLQFHFVLSSASEPPELKRFNPYRLG